jgi:hypothetical protein
VLSLVLSSAGCTADRSLFGKYHGNHDPASVGVKGSPLEGALTAVFLELFPDKTFTMSDGGIPLEGTYTYNSKSVSLTITTVLNQRIDRQPESVIANSEYSLSRTEKDLILVQKASQEKVRLVKTP